MGEEEHLTARVLAAIKEGCRAAAGAAAGFNEDRFVAGESSIDAVLGAARTAPMMAPRRLVIVTGLDRWEKKGDEADGADARVAGRGEGPLDRLARYFEEPLPTTVLVLTARKLNGSRRLVKVATKAGALVSAAPLARRELPGWIAGEARARGHALDRGLAELVAELCGPALGPVADALDRLSLYVGPTAPIDEAAVAAVVTRLRREDVWALCDALAARRLGPALAALGDAVGGPGAREAALPLLGMIAWKVRQLAKVAAAIARGKPGAAAAQQAGVPPFKVAEVERAARALGVAEIERWLGALAEADLALKGSRRSDAAVLTALVTDLCRG
jgi:DNA polymerase-3 subunit delta